MLHVHYVVHHILLSGDVKFYC